MPINQISVFVENKQGRLSQITSVLKKNRIDIRALCIADTSDFGILRLIVDDPDKAYAALKDAKCTVSMTSVLAAEVPDSPGGLDSIVAVLAENEISVEYVYAFISRAREHAYVILKASDPKSAAAVLTAKGVRLVDGDKLYNI